jgi:hypothetical protein
VKEHTQTNKKKKKKNFHTGSYKKEKKMEKEAWRTFTEPWLLTWHHLKHNEHTEHSEEEEDEQRSFPLWRKWEVATLSDLQKIDTNTPPTLPKHVFPLRQLTYVGNDVFELFTPWEDFYKCHHVVYSPNEKDNEMVLWNNEPLLFYNDAMAMPSIGGKESVPSKVGWIDPKAAVIPFNFYPFVK